mgnify:CR=1 FL=1
MLWNIAPETYCEAYIYNKHVSTTDKDVRVAPVTVDFMSTFSFRGTPAFYFKYRPCNLLRNGYGLKFRTLSLGLMF